jgi:Uma2 family endonuclease
VNALVSVQAWLVRTFGEQFVNPEAPIDVAPEDNPTNEPEPDLVVLAKPSLEYWERNPRPSDLRLVVEISDSTLGFDLTAKAELYARAGIIEYWVVDVAARRLIVHRDPRAGLYRLVTAYAEQETLAPLAAPHSEFRIAEAF